MTLLLHRWADQPGEPARGILDRTLHGMARGGVYDQLGGGFHRYSVDAEWIVPHFEKMSYDNSELLKVYLDAYALFGSEEYASAARGIVRWVREVTARTRRAATRPARTPTSASTTTATTSPGPGTRRPPCSPPRSWRSPRRTTTSAPRARCTTIPAKNVLFVAATVPQLATRTRPAGRAGPGDSSSARAPSSSPLGRTRPAPFVDRTRYANWNAMMASALLRAGAVLGDEDARRHALAHAGAPAPRARRPRTPWPTRPAA